MNKKYPMRLLRSIILSCVVISTSLSSFAQATPIFADPALGSFDITDLSDVSVDANTLMLNSIYKLKLDVFNLSLTPGNVIPPGTSYIDVGLGTKFILNPAFTINAPTLTAYFATCPLSNYFTFTYVTTGSQKIIRCNIKDTIPKDFSGVFEFQVKANVLGTSTVTGNFFISNTNPAFTLSDENSGNNNAFLIYTITNLVPVTITDFKAKNTECTIKIDWAVGQEINVDKYDAEFSKDGSNFEKEITVAAEHKNNYTTTVLLSDRLKSPTLFVRLKTINKDGTFNYSPIYLVDGTCNGKQKNNVYCYPNPISRDKTITVASKDVIFKGNYQLNVIDVAGKMYLTKQIALDSVYSFKFSITNTLSSGNYFIVLKKDDKTIEAILPFVKED